MKFRFYSFRLSIITLFAVWYIFFSTSVLQAQTDEPTIDSPQFIYRDSEHLVLVNAVSGETEILTGIQAKQRDYLSVSPSGHYLMMITEDTDSNVSYCLNIYEIETQKFLYRQPIHCNIQTAEFSNDDTSIAFSTRSTDAEEPALWLHKFSTGTTQLLYDKSLGTSIYESGVGITDIRWSPSGNYMSFVIFTDIMGGSLNFLHILNVETLREYGVGGFGDFYYATYNPLWSPDENWILLALKEEYVAGGSRPFTNHEGDLYLINSKTGEQHRLTFTPAEYESGPRWTVDGSITYVIPQTVTLSVDEALDLQPPDEIIEPEEIDFSMPLSCITEMASPAQYYVARICSSLKGSDPDAKQLFIFVDGYTTYTDTLPSNQYYSRVLIGWRIPN